MRDDGMGLMIFAVIMMFFLANLGQMNNPAVIVVSEQEIQRQQQAAEQKKEAQRVAEAYEKREVCKTLVINYEVEYDTIYTGDQTPLIQRGVYKSRLMCGMKNTPAFHLIPHNMAMPITFDNGRHAHLWLPFFALLNGEPQAIMNYQEKNGAVKMIVDARTEEAEDGLVAKVFVKATPATEAQWNADYRRGRGV